MAKAMFCGFSCNKNIKFSYYSKTNRHKEIEAKASPEEVVNWADVVVLCVKPQELSGVLTQIKNCCFHNKIILSPVLGKSIAFIEGYLGKNVGIIRIMPNLAAAYKMSVTAYAASSNNELISRIKINLELLGKVVEIKETDFSLFTAVFGSGPAFILKMLEAMKTKIADIKNIDTDNLLTELISGTAMYAAQNQAKNINELINNIASKGGSTEAGLQCMSENNFDEIISKVINASKQKSDKLNEF